MKYAPVDSFILNIIRLLVFVIALFIDHIEEPQFIHALACRHHTQPVSQLLLLEKFLCPAQMLSASGTYCGSYTTLQVLQVASTEGNVRHNLNFSITDL